MSNLKGHQRRNLKTSIMYSVALAFLIMTGCNIAQQKELFSSVTKLFLASDLVAFFPPTFVGGLEETELRGFFKEIKSNTGLVQDFTFISKAFWNTVFSRNKNNLVGPLGGYPVLPLITYAVERNYLETVNTEYYYPISFDDIKIKKLEDGQLDAIDALYSNENLNNSYKLFDEKDILVTEEKYKNMSLPRVSQEIVKVVIPQGIINPAELDIKQYSRFCTDSRRTGPCEKTYVSKIRAILNKLPGFFFSGFEQSSLLAMGVITMDTYRVLMLDFFSSHQSLWKEYNNTIRDRGFTYGIPKERVLVKMKSGSTKFDREIVSSGMMNFFKNDLTVLFDTTTMNEVADSNINILVVFLIIVGIIAITLAFFLLLLSNISNIRENIWEFGILRAVGLSKAQVTRIFLYESFSVIISSMIIGFGIGIVIAVTSDLQTTLFLELPYRIIFPTALFFIMLALSLITTFCASYFPANKVNQLSVSDVIRGNV